VDNATSGNNSEVHLIAKLRFMVIVRLTGVFRQVDSRQVDDVSRSFRGNDFNLLR
jgi:hypothetical protein